MAVQNAHHVNDPVAYMNEFVGLRIFNTHSHGLFRVSFLLQTIKWTHICDKTTCISERKLFPVQSMAPKAVHKPIALKTLQITDVKYMYIY